MSDDLKSFKIENAQKRRVDRAPTASQSKGDEAPAEPESVGFPHIEAQVETDGPALPAMRERFETLSELANSAGSPKAKANAKKAATAYERALALLDHLLQTKSQMVNPGEQAEE